LKTFLLDKGKVLLFQVLRSCLQLVFGFKVDSLAFRRVESRAVISLGVGEMHHFLRSSGKRMFWAGEIPTALATLSLT
jgi:SpoU rRNA methylase family enzyme